MAMSATPMSTAASSNAHDEGMRVFIRIRPLSTAEKKKNPLSSIDIRNDEIEVRNSKGVFDGSRSYSFSRVFGPAVTQEELYDVAVSPVIDDVVQGYNCTVFAYGQTGTGKTYTMEGERSRPSLAWDEDPEGGVIPRAVHNLFLALRTNSNPNTKIVLSVSYVELYNENLYDLLVENGHIVDAQSSLKLFNDPNQAGSVVIKGVTKKNCLTKEEVLSHLEYGATNRKKASTKLNARSSRSHAIFMITVFMSDDEMTGRARDGTGMYQHNVKVGKLNLVDLAGSENVGRSGAKDKQAREAGSINKSLLNLGIVINALASGKDGHIPYRGSKLTRILQDSLGGRTKTTLIATASPVMEHMEETQSTLEYACKAKCIINHPEISERSWKKQSLSEYAERVERLRKDLNATRAQFGICMAKTDYEQWLKSIDERNVAWMKLNEEYEAAGIALREFEETYRVLMSSVEERANEAKEKEIEACVLENVGLDLAERHAKIVSKATEAINVSKKAANELFASHDASDRMKEINTSNRAYYYDYMAKCKGAGAGALNVKLPEALRDGPRSSIDEFLDKTAKLSCVAFTQLQKASAEHSAMHKERAKEDDELSKSNITFAKTSVARSSINPEWNQLLSAAEANTDGIGHMYETMAEAQVKMRAEVQAGLTEAETKFDGAEQTMDENRKNTLASWGEVSNDTAAFGKDVKEYAQMALQKGKEASKKYDAARKLIAEADSDWHAIKACASSARSRLPKVIEAHERLETESAAGFEAKKAEANSLMESGLQDLDGVGKKIEEMRDGMKADGEKVSQAEGDWCKKFQADVKALADKEVAEINERSATWADRKQQALNDFTCSELKRTMMGQKIESNWSEVKTSLEAVASQANGFLSALKQKWGETVPEAVSAEMAKMVSSVAGVVQVTDRFLGEDFSAYQPTGGTPVRRGEGPGMGTPFRLPSAQTPITPKDVMAARHRERILRMRAATENDGVEQPDFQTEDEDELNGVAEEILDEKENVENDEKPVSGYADDGIRGSMANVAVRRKNNK